MRSWFVVAAACLLVPAASQAGPITVDGLGSDWGIDPGSGDWTSSVGTRIFFADYTGTDGNGYLGPGWGGQYCDVEAIYAYRGAGRISFAIVTGLDPDGLIHNGTEILPGDIFLDVGNGWKTAIDLPTGNVFENVIGTIPTFPVSAPYSIQSGTLIGSTELAASSDGLPTIYTSGNHSSKHFIIEGSVDVGLIGGAGKEIGIHWTMSCGNDLGEGTVPNVPEPATLSLVGLGAAVLGFARRRRVA